MGRRDREKLLGCLKRHRSMVGVDGWKKLDFSALSEGRMTGCGMCLELLEVDYSKVGIR